jgi:hypothetical protein
MGIKREPIFVSSVEGVPWVLGVACNGNRVARNGKWDNCEARHGGARCYGAVSHATVDGAWISHLVVLSRRSLGMLGWRERVSIRLKELKYDSNQVSQ